MSERPYYDVHLFVCMNERAADHPRGCCGESRGGAIREQFAKMMRLHGVGTFRANKAGCLDRCELGPVVVVYPEGIWYRIEDPAVDVEEIVVSHFRDGKVVDRLRLPARTTEPAA
jgi:(2Fe-2S) ferredoxin